MKQVALCMITTWIWLSQVGYAQVERGVGDPIENNLIPPCKIVGDEVVCVVRLTSRRSATGASVQEIVLTNGDALYVHDTSTKLTTGSCVNRFVGPVPPALLCYLKNEHNRKQLFAELESYKGRALPNTLRISVLGKNVDINRGLEVMPISRYPEAIRMILSEFRKAHIGELTEKAENGDPKGDGKTGRLYEMK